MSAAEAEPVAHVAWYRRDQWDQLRAVAADPESLEGSYDEWLVAITHGLDELVDNGVKVQPIEVDIDALVAWCAADARAIDGSARAEFAAHEAARRSEEAPGA